MSCPGKQEIFAGVDVPNNPVNTTNNKVLRNCHPKYFLPKVNIINYNILIDRRKFYDQPIIDLIKQYDEIRKTTTGQGDIYTRGCLLDYQYLIIVRLLVPQRSLKYNCS